MKSINRQKAGTGKEASEGIETTVYPLPDAATEHGQPLYLTVARRLLAQIADNTYPVGSLLPPETELAVSLGISRQTLRQALSEIREMGMISAKRGVGTKVESAHPKRRLDFSSRSIEDLTYFAKGTRLIVASRQRFMSTDAIEGSLGIPAKHRWVHCGCLRESLQDNEPFCWTDIYVDERYSELLGSGEIVNTPVFYRIEREEEAHLTEIHQVVRGVVLGVAVAGSLGVTEGSPGLEITRQYFLPNRNLVEVSVNTIPSSRYQFSLEMDLSRRDSHLRQL